MRLNALTKIDGKHAVAVLLILAACQAAPPEVTWTGPDPPPCAELSSPIIGPSACMLGADARLPPLSLADTGCFSSLTPLTVAEGVIPYAINAPLFSDGADKRRWISPTGPAIDDENGELDFPTGTVLLKHFELDSEPLETRLMIRTETDWAFHTYVWDGDDAVRDGAGQILDVGFDWQVPSQNACGYCHGSTRRVLGPEIGQLDRGVCYDADEERSQLDALVEWGVLPQIPTDISALVDPLDESQSLPDRARSYLHVNCASCHRPGGWTPPNMTMDLRFDTPLHEAEICGVPIQFMGAIDNSELRLDPGNPIDSQLYVRLSGGGLGKMPPFGTHIDSMGTSLIGAWIQKMSTCN
jgi:hypothetical protein